MRGARRRPSHRLLTRRRYDDTGILMMMVMVMVMSHDDDVMVMVMMADLHRDLGDLFTGRRLLGKASIIGLQRG